MNKLKTIIIGLLLNISIVAFAQAGEKNFIDQNYIEVTGKAELEVSPDMIYIKIVLSDRNNKDKLPLPEIEKRMISKLSEIGIDVSKDLSLLDFVSNMRTFFVRKDVILTKHYQLVVHDSKTLQQVFFELQELGISSVSITKMEHSKIEKHRQDVKISAVKAAKEKAELLANALNQNIGKAIYVQEVVNLPRNALSNVVGMSAGTRVGSWSSRGSEPTETDIEIEKIKVESMFLVRFALE